MGSPPFLSMDPGLLQIYAIAAPETSLEVLEKEIWEEVENLRQTLLPAAELEKVKKQLRSSLLRNLETLFFKGLMAGMYQVRAGDFRLIYSVLPGYDSVTSEDILRVAQKYLRPENRTVVTLHPVSTKEHGELGELE